MPAPAPAASGCMARCWPAIWWWTTASTATRTLRPPPRTSMSPPFAPRATRNFWRGLQAGNLHTTATDHCTFCAAQKAAGKDDFAKIPNGCGGVEERLAVIWDGREHRAPDAERVRRHHLGQHGQAVQHLPAKGLRVRGADADLVVWDPAGTRRCPPRRSTARVTHNIFEGRTVKGIPSPPSAKVSWCVCAGRSAGGEGQGPLHQTGTIQFQLCGAVAGGGVGTDCGGTAMTRFLTGQNSRSAQPTWGTVTGLIKSQSPVQHH